MRPYSALDKIRGCICERLFRLVQTDNRNFVAFVELLSLGALLQQQNEEQDGRSKGKVRKPLGE